MQNSSKHAPIPTFEMCNRHQIQPEKPACCVCTNFNQIQGLNVNISLHVSRRRELILLENINLTPGFLKKKDMQACRAEERSGRHTNTKTSVSENHLGQEVRRLSSHVFQNERGFSVQIGMLGWRVGEEIKKRRAEEETTYREVSARWFSEAY